MYKVSKDSCPTCYARSLSYRKLSDGTFRFWCGACAKLWDEQTNRPTKGSE